MASNNENQILKPLIDNASEEGVKPVTQNDGNAVLFQRDIDLPTTEKLEDAYDEVDDISQDIQNSNQYKEINVSKDDDEFPQNSYIEEKQDSSSRFYGSPKKTYTSKNQYDEDEEEEEEEDVGDIEEPKGNNYYVFKKDIPAKKYDESKPKNKYEKPKLRISSNAKSHITEKRKKSTNSTPENVSSSTPPKRSSNSPNDKSKKSTIHYKYNYNSSNSKIFEILGYFFIILAILLGILISKYKENESDFTIFNEYELDAITRLNDCVTPIEFIPISNYPSSFIDFIQNGSSKYLKYDDEMKSVAIKIPHQSLFCKAISFGDRHPDLCGLFIVWMIVFIYFMHYSISRARAERIVPDVMKLLRSNRMCYLDEAKKKMKESGYWIFGAWWQVVKIISNNDDVKTVKMVDTKPFWSFNDN